MTTKSKKIQKGKKQRTVVVERLLLLQLSLFFLRYRNASLSFSVLISLSYTHTLAFSLSLYIFSALFCRRHSSFLCGSLLVYFRALSGGISHFSCPISCLSRLSFIYIRNWLDTSSIVFSMSLSPCARERKRREHCSHRKWPSCRPFFHLFFHVSSSSFLSSYLLYPLGIAPFLSDNERVL